MSNEYVIAGGRPGFERLRVLSRVWGESTESLLRSVGVGPGQRCLDVGCGAGAVTLFLATLVGPTGAVVGVDPDEVQLDLVRQECQRLGAANVELELGDVMELESSDAYDVVYSRFLLEHLPDPLEALRRMWRAVRPGGLLVAEDGDFLAEFCEPANPGFDFWMYAYQETLRRNGGDPLSGRRLHSRFREVGVPGPHLNLVQYVFLSGEGKLMPYLTVARTASRIVDSGVATQAEVDQAMAQLRELADDTTSAVSSPRVFQCWARKPELTDRPVAD
ncbi:MAG TPA: methyltransferase domain-containing protein [Lapillicoccus sp.]|nr:methyltransferase domain-containing protein [Lapillicoccus sp.]